MGVTKESEVQAVIDKAEQDSEARIKLDEVRREIRRLMALRAEGHKLVQRGWRHWQPVWYPAIRRKGKCPK